MKITTGAGDMKLLLCADFLDQIDGFGVREGFILILPCVSTLTPVSERCFETYGIVFFANCNSRKGASLLTQKRHDLASVDSSDRWDALSFTPVAKAFYSSPMRVFLSNVCDHYATRLQRRRFEMAEETVFVKYRARYTVVAYQWLREDEDLTPI